MATLKALTKIEDGSRDGVVPGEIFEIGDKKEAARLIECGAATDNLTVKEASGETGEPDELLKMVKALKMDELKMGLEQLQVEFDEKAKKANLQQALLIACEANPIQATAFFDSL